MNKFFGGRHRMMKMGETRAFLFVFCLCVAGVSCAFFDLTDVDDPLALLWSTPNNVVNQQQSLCNVNSNGEITQGVCRSRTECLLTGGTPRGFCGLLSACCLYTRSCGKTSGSKVSYFTSEGYTTENQCGFRVRLLNQRICQLRIDFHTLNLEPPVLQPNNAYLCEERFEVSPLKIGVPAICGSNDGQHMYIEVNGTQDKYVWLNIFLKPRTAADRKPKWNIEVTQLECPGLRSFIGKTDNHAAQDFPLIAPRYALQYFTERAGVIRSFGYDSTVNAINKYASNQHYTIAFKRGPLDCGMEFTTQFLNLQMVGPVGCIDYIFIPGDLETNRICSSDGEQRIISRMPGPFYVHFFASSTNTGITPGVGENAGFQIYYNYTSCPRINTN